MDEEAQNLILEMMDLLGAGYRPAYSTLEKELYLYEVVEKLTAHHGDKVVRGMLRALGGWPHLSGDLKVRLQRFL
jgi:hypothetical protein